MNYLEKKIEFHGDKVLTFQDQETGKIYVAVTMICSSLGMSGNQRDTQVKKIKSDETLKLGSKELAVKIDGQVREQMFIELEFLTGWLFKINPARFAEELKEKLLDYQLHCKDILADAFFGKRSNQVLEGEYSPEDIEILQRVERIIKNKTSIVDFLVDIALDYDWIIERAGTGFEKIKLKYQEMQQRTFMIGGKALSLEDIDSLNADQKKEILKKLEKRKN